MENTDFGHMAHTAQGFILDARDLLTGEEFTPETFDKILEDLTRAARLTGLVAIGMNAEKRKAPRNMVLDALENR